MVVERGPHPENPVGCGFIIKGEVWRGEDHLPPLSGGDIMLASAAPPPRQAGGPLVTALQK